MKSTKKPLKKTDLLALDKGEFIDLFLNLQEALHETQTELTSSREQYLLLMEQVLLAQKNRFGKKSETMSSLDFPSLFDEAELLADPTVPEPTLEDIIEPVEEIVETPKKKRQARLYPKDLEVVDVYHNDIQPTEAGFEFLSYKTHDELSFQPAQWFIKRHHYPVFKRDKEDGGTQFINPSIPVPLIKGSLVSSEAASHLISLKYNLGLPFYRIERDMKTKGFNLSRQTMSNWALKLSEDYGELLVNRMRQKLLEMDTIHIDETTVQVDRLHFNGQIK